MIRHHSSPEKARHNISVLDGVRCRGQWPELPEAYRKVQKHAPDRRVLLLSASLEYDLVARSSLPTTPKLPQPQITGLIATLPLGERVERLRVEARNEQSHKEDAFQARITTAYGKFWLQEFDQVLILIPHELDAQYRLLVADSGVSRGWTYACLAKATYMRGYALESLGKPIEAAHWYDKMLQFLNRETPTEFKLPEYHMWYERLLHRYCLITGGYISNYRSPSSLLTKGEAGIEPSILFNSYRAWAEYFAGFIASQSSQQHFIQCSEAEYRQKIWKSYYDTLSIVLQERIPLPAFSSPEKMYKELIDVQSEYAQCLYLKHHFPAADTSSPEIEEWVDQLTANWKALLDAPWKNYALESVAKTDYSERVLCLLLQAGGKCFQSTALYRNLFMVHTSLAQWRLAKRALGIYLDLVNRSKARSRKHVEGRPPFDDRVTAIRTVAVGIEMLSMYGNVDEIEQAQVIGKQLKVWLYDTSPGNARPDLRLPPDVLTQAYRTLGLMKAMWARNMDYPKTRKELLQKSIKYYRLSLQSSFGDEDNLAGHYGLAMVLVDANDPPQAITVVKEAISKHSRFTFDDSDLGNQLFGDTSMRVPNARDRSTILKCWQLLISLLDQGAKYAQALESVEAAFLPYGGKSTLRGAAIGLNMLLVWSVEEKCHLLELKMTQISLTVMSADVSTAVDMCEELTKLYVNLFGTDLSGNEQVPKPAPPSVPTSGTRKSIRKSLLHIPTGAHSPTMGQASIPASSVGSLERPTTGATGPAIAISTDTEVPMPLDTTHYRGFLGRHGSNKLRKRPSRPSVTGRSRATSPAIHSSPGRSQQKGQATRPPNIDSSSFVTDDLSLGSPHSPDEIGIAMTHDLPLGPQPTSSHGDRPNPLHSIPSAAHNMDRRNPNKDPIAPNPGPYDWQRKTPKITHGIKHLHVPLVDYPAYIEDRRSQAFLVKIWLFIASVYRHATMFPDAEDAVDEARTLVFAVGQNISDHEGCTAETLYTPGHGGLKSYDELMADLFTARAELLLHEEKYGTGYRDGAERFVRKGKAMAAYRNALLHSPGHVDATMGQTKMMLDNYQDLWQVYNPVPSILNPQTGEYEAPEVNTDGRDGEPPYGGIPPQTQMQFVADLDLAMKNIKALTESAVGANNVGAWNALGRAYLFYEEREKALECYEVGLDRSRLLAML